LKIKSTARASTNRRGSTGSSTQRAIRHPPLSVRKRVDPNPRTVGQTHRSILFGRVNWWPQPQAWPRPAVLVRCCLRKRSPRLTRRHRATSCRSAFDGDGARATNIDRSRSVDENDKTPLLELGRRLGHGVGEGRTDPTDTGISVRPAPPCLPLKHGKCSCDLGCGSSSTSGIAFAAACARSFGPGLAPVGGGKLHAPKITSEFGRGGGICGNPFFGRRFTSDSRKPRGTRRSAQHGATRRNGSDGAGSNWEAMRKAGCPA
jgi:hypothetical protein